MDYHKIMQEKIESDCRRAIFGDEPTQTFSEKTATPEEIFKDIQGAMDILWPKKREYKFRNWEVLKWNLPILKNPPVLTRITA